ncbi:hypothetical protein C3K47_19320, partial [Solitalea longa]
MIRDTQSFNIHVLINSKKPFLKLMLLLCFIFLGLATYGQSVGDYQSKGSGDWNVLATWERWNGTAWVEPTLGQGYPGQYTGTKTVSIQSGNDVKLNVNPNSFTELKVSGTVSITSGIVYTLITPLITIKSSGTLAFGNNGSGIIVPGASVTYSSVLAIEMGGKLISLDQCNSQKDIWLNGVHYASCNGGGGQYSFAQLMANRGSIDATTSYNPMCVGNPLNLFATVTGANNTSNVTYKWSGPNTLPAHQVYSTNNSNISISGLSAGGPYLYIVTAIDPFNNATNFDSIKVTVNPLPNATISGSTTVCQNAASPVVTFTGSNGTAPYTFTYNINGGSNQTITTTSGNSVTIAVPTGTVGTFNYNLVSVKDGSAAGCLQNLSGTATVTVSAPITNNTLPNPSQSSYNCGVNESINGSMPTVGNYGPGLVFKWQSSTDGSAWTDIPSSNSQNFVPGLLTSTTYFRRIVTSGDCAVSISNTIVYNITQNPFTNNTIYFYNGAQTSGCGSFDPGQIGGDYPSSGGYINTYTFQWQSSIISASAGFSNIPGAIGQQYDPPVLTQTTYFKRIATSGGCSFETNVLVLTVGTTTPAVPTITTSAATCSAAGSSTISNYSASNTYIFTPTGPTVGAGGVISGMTTGTSYTVTAGNGGCTSAPSSSFTNAAMLTAPAVPTASVTTQPTCAV